jgi:predicted HicB family RNase H-like nuclease
MSLRKKPATKRRKSNLLRKLSVPANRDLHEHVTAAAAAAGMTISTYIKMALYKSTPVVVAIEH